MANHSLSDYLFTQSEAAYPSVTAAVRYCHEPLLDGNVCSATQYATVKECAFADCVSVLYDQQDSTLLL